jgi:hypothetical protein
MPINVKTPESHVDNVNESAQPWEQPGTLSATHEAFRHHAEIATTYPKGPHQMADIPVEMAPQHEDIFHPVKAIGDILGAINGLTSQLDLLLKQMVLERTFSDDYASLGSTVSYTVDYKERKYLYALAWGTITLQAPQGTIALTSGKWTNVSLPRGTQLTIQGGSDSAPVVITFRHCDVIMN